MELFFYSGKWSCHLLIKLIPSCAAGEAESKLVPNRVPLIEPDLYYTSSLKKKSRDEPNVSKGIEASDGEGKREFSGAQLFFSWGFPSKLLLFFRPRVIIIQN